MSDRITLADYRASTATTRGEKPTSKRPIAPTEHAEQAALIAWARANEARYPQLALLLAIPNGAKLPYGKSRDGKRFSREALKLKAEGLRNGTPDLFLAWPKVGTPGLFIEMKRAKKSLSRTSEDQRTMIDALRSVGYRAEICYGWEAARDVLLSYITGRAPVVAPSFSWDVFFGQTCPAIVKLYQDLRTSHGDRQIADILPVCFGVAGLNDITPKKLLSWLKQMRIPADSPSYKYVERYVK